MLNDDADGAKVISEGSKQRHTALTELNNIHNKVLIKKELLVCMHILSAELHYLTTKPNACSELP